jgi:hypothetical protein
MLLAAPASGYALNDDSAGWIPLFDGRSLSGWKASGHESSFKVVDGQIVAHGPRAQLYYAGPVNNSDFKNFELSLDAMARPGADSWFFFHTAYRPIESPTPGLAVRICSSQKEAKPGLEAEKTGSLYPYRNIYKQLVPDNEWFELNILVRGKQVQVRINRTLVVDYVEPDQPFLPDPLSGALGHGTFAIPVNGPTGTTCFKNIRVRPLPDNATALSDEKPVVDEVYREIVRLGAENFPVVDYHVHLKGGLTIEQALANSRRAGIFYGVAINCGLGFPVHDDASVREYLETMKGQPCYVALQGEGREWITLTSPESIARFDYCFTDAMTFSDDHGKRMRTWIPEEVGVIEDRQAFMDMLVKRIVGVLHEPIDIYANATYIPDQMAAEYDALWTPERMRTVIDAAVENGVAIEINARRQIPSPRFIKAAKAAGAKFSLGTNNGEAELGRLEYPIRMVRECGLHWNDIFVPKPDGQKPIQVKKPHKS